MIGNVTDAPQPLAMTVGSPQGMARGANDLEIPLVNSVTVLRCGVGNTDTAIRNQSTSCCFFFCISHLTPKLSALRVHTVQAISELLTLSAHAAQCRAPSDAQATPRTK